MHKKARRTGGVCEPTPAASYPCPFFPQSKQAANQGGEVGNPKEDEMLIRRKKSMVVVMRAEARVCKPSGYDAVASKQPADKKGSREEVDTSIESRGGGVGGEVVCS